MTRQEEIVAWSYWKIKGGPRPAGVRALIPKEKAPGDNWWEFLTWAKWRIFKKGVPPRPANVRARIPKEWHVLRGKLATKLGTAIIQPPTGPFTPVPSKTKGRPGLYFYSAQNAPFDMVEKAIENNLWVAFLTHELDDITEEQCPIHLVRELKDAGVPLVASGWVDPYFNLTRQADVIKRVMDTGNFVEYMANAEFPWAWTHVPGNDPTPGFHASGTFAPMVRDAIGPTTALSLSIMWGQVIWLRPWLEAGLSVVRPQCYINEWPHMEADEAVRRLGHDQGDLIGGIPPHMVNPTYGSYGNLQKSMTDYQATHSAAKALGAKGASVWAAEFVPTSEYPILAQMG